MSARRAASTGGVSYEIRVDGSPSPAVLFALHQRSTAVPSHVVVVVEAHEGDLVDILNIVAVPGAEVESVRVTPVPTLPHRHVPPADAVTR